MEKILFIYCFLFVFLSNAQKQDTVNNIQPHVSIGFQPGSFGVNLPVNNQLKSIYESLGRSFLNLTSSYKGGQFHFGYFHKNYNFNQLNYSHITATGNGLNTRLGYRYLQFSHIFVQSFLDLDFENINFSNSVDAVEGRYQSVNYGISTDIGFGFNNHDKQEAKSRYINLGMYIHVRYGTSNPYTFLHNNDIRNNHIQIGLGFHGSFGRW